MHNWMAPQRHIFCLIITAAVIPDPFDPALPAMLRGIGADLRAVGTHVSRLLSDLSPPPPGAPLATAHAFATGLARNAAAFLTWVESSGFPATARSRRTEFRAGAERLAVAARRLSAATEQRRVDELVERATEALCQASRSLDAATQGVLSDVTLQLQSLAVAVNRIIPSLGNGADGGPCHQQRSPGGNGKADASAGGLAAG
jgi:hypothetical protein